MFDVVASEQPLEVEHNTPEVSLDVSDHALIVQIHRS
jgi:hypothetical protein